MNKINVAKKLLPSIKHSDGTVQASTMSGIGLILARIGVLVGTATFAGIPDLFTMAFIKLPAMVIIAEVSWFAITLWNIWKDDERKINMKPALEKWAEGQGYKK